MLKNNHREPTQICKLFYDNAKLPFLFMLHLHKNFTHRRHFFFGITTKFCNSFKKIPFHWPKLALYTQRLITLIKPVFKHRLCKKTFYKNVYTVNLPIRYAKKRNGQRSNFTLMTGIEKFYRYTYHIAPGITYNVHNMIRSPTIEGPSKIIRYT